VRGAVRADPVLACTVNVTVPLPAPLPLVTAIHEGAPVVDHEHPLDVVTVAVVVPPAEGTVLCAGETAYVHAIGTAD
jgi:hypothetical protein